MKRQRNFLETARKKGRCNYADVVKDARRCDIGEFRLDNLSLFALKGNRTLPFIFLPWYVWGFKLIASRGQSRDLSIRLISVTVNEKRRI